MSLTPWYAHFQQLVYLISIVRRSGSNDFEWTFPKIRKFLWKSASNFANTVEIAAGAWGAGRNRAGGWTGRGRRGSSGWEEEEGGKRTRKRKAKKPARPKGMCGWRGRTLMKKRKWLNELGKSSWQVSIYQTGSSVWVTGRADGAVEAASWTVVKNKLPEDLQMIKPLSIAFVVCGRSPAEQSLTRRRRRRGGRRRGRRRPGTCVRARAPRRGCCWRAARRASAASTWKARTWRRAGPWPPPGSSGPRRPRRARAGTGRSRPGAGSARPAAAPAASPSRPPLRTRTHVPTHSRII